LIVYKLIWLNQLKKLLTICYSFLKKRIKENKKVTSKQMENNYSLERKKKRFFVIFVLRLNWEYFWSKEKNSREQGLSLLKVLETVISLQALVTMSLVLQAVLMTSLQNSLMPFLWMTHSLILMKNVI